MPRLITLFVLSGCSFAFVSGPPANYRQVPYFNCTESRVAPVLDTVWTALMALDVLALGVENDADWAKSAGCTAGDPSCPAISRHGAMMLDGALGIAGAAAMLYGYTKTGECRQAKSEVASRQQPYGPMPGSWPPPQGQPYPPQGPSYPPQPGTWPPPQQPTPTQGAPASPPVPPQPAPAP